MRLAPLLALGLATIALPAASGHELKVMASRLFSEPGSDETVYISYGHVLPIGGMIDAETLDDYHIRTPSGSVTYLKKEGSSLQANQVHVDERGVYQAVAARRPAIWCEVVDAAGKHGHVRGPRSSITEGQVEQATRSTMYAKALMVAGKESSEPPAPLGHELEIVPTQAPAAWLAGEDLTFQVLFRGEPLRGADVVATYVGFKPDGAWCYATSTNPDGQAVVRPSRAGTWVVRVKTQRPAPADANGEYDLESYTATLVLEVQP
jgi:uncharacterized GH25 family protein